MRNKRQWKMKFRPRYSKDFIRWYKYYLNQFFMIDRWVDFGISATANVRLREYTRARNKLSGHHRI